MTKAELIAHSGSASEFTHSLCVVPIEYALAAIKAEQEACKQACAAIREAGNGTANPSEDNHADGFTDGCNECEWAIYSRITAL